MPLLRLRFPRLLPSVLGAACALLCASAAYASLAEGKDYYDKSRFAEARKELADLAEAQDGEAMHLMGDMLLRGQVGARDELKAREYILKAHDKAVIGATFLLGRMHLVGNLVAKDEAKGIDLIKRAAEKSYAPAQTLMGVWIEEGLSGYSKDEAIALTWYKVAAEQKEHNAMYRLGSYHESGAGGLTADPLVALDWYRKSAAFFNSNSMVAAGRIYAMGKGVAPDGAEALRWLRKAAALTNSAAYPWLGSVYEFGRGGAVKNTVLAYAWYAAVPANAPAYVVKAAADGKERIGRNLPAADLAEAEKQSRSVVAQNAVVELPLMFGGAAGASAGTDTARRGVYGSGVVVSPVGDIVTNEHVVQGCSKLRIQPGNVEVKVVAKDSKNDLALLRAASNQLPAIKLRAGRGIRLGDDLIAIGFPLRGLLSSGPVVTSGIVNAMSGALDDTSAFQMSATVQPGSSGGPILDRQGLLVGIVRARLLPTAAANPQNVNFGINLATVSGFLDAHAVDYAAIPNSTANLSVVDVAASAQRATVQVECY
jgi:uncharacterized protein